MMVKNLIFYLISVDVTDAFRWSFLKQRSITCGIHSLITLHQSAYAIRPNTALNHNRCIFKSRLKILEMFVSENFVHAPNALESFPTPKRYDEPTEDGSGGCFLK